MQLDVEISPPAFVRNLYKNIRSMVKIALDYMLFILLLVRLNLQKSQDMCTLYVASVAGLAFFKM